MQLNADLRPLPESDGPVANTFNWFQVQGQDHPIQECYTFGVFT